MQEELEKAAKDFQELTGLKLNIESVSEYDYIQTVDRIRTITNSYREKFCVEYILKLAMTGQPVELLKHCQRFHINPDRKRQLFLIKSKHSTKLITRILSGMFPSGRNFTVELENDEFALICEIKNDEHSCENLARYIADSLASEAMVGVDISYSRFFDEIGLLNEMYNSCKLSLSIGMIFYSDKNIFSSENLGVGGLIYNIPINVCENFLRELFGKNIDMAKDPEMQHTINTFLENNLNIAETARKLHMHRNTLVYRIDQFEKTLGIEIKTIDGAMTFRIATMVINYLKYIKGAI